MKMAKSLDPEFSSVLYLAYALPQIREASEEAAFLLEEAILECAISLSASAKPGREKLDLATFLGYALTDVETITPVGVNLLKQAIGSLRGVRRNDIETQSQFH